ncbi:MAG: hypothetical protein WBO36_13030 [Saprospiraceae bacterium]
MLPRISKILQINGFIVTCKWNNGEERAIDFSRLLSDYPAEIMHKILDRKVFQTIKVNHEAKTIYFPNILQFTTPDGEAIQNYLDFSPDVLYSHSQKIEMTLN